MLFRIALIALAFATSAAAQTPADTLDFSDVTPEIIGGLAGLQSSIVYPAADREAGRQGMVVVRFVVTAEGKATDIRVARSVSPGLDAAAVEAVGRTRFRPGAQNGQPVNVRITLPIRFTIRDDAAASPAETGFPLVTLMTRLGQPQMPAAIPPADSSRITQSVLWGEMIRFTWNGPMSYLDRVDAYSSADTLRFVALTFAPDSTGALDDMRRRLDAARLRPQDDGFYLAYDLATHGFSGEADVKLQREYRSVTYRQPLCRDARHPGDCAPPFPTLVGGLRVLQESLSYPLVARRAGTSGEFAVAVDVRADGSVSAVRVVSNSVRGTVGHQALAEAALAAVARATFAPATRSGIPVASTLVVPVRFSIR